MNHEALQKAANIVSVINAIYSMRNRIDIPTAILNKYDPIVKQLNNEFNTIVFNQIFTTQEADLSTEKALENRLTEEKNKLKNKKPNKKISKSE